MPGVYLVLRPSISPPDFLNESKNGHFKGKDPTVTVSLLAGRWVDDAVVLNTGKAGPGRNRKVTLRSRLTAYMRFGQGRPVGHWGGRYIWQLSDAVDLLICWKATHNAPRSQERRLIQEFKKTYETLPFANITN
jgi:hypothetical protein